MTDIINDLRLLGSPEKAQHLQRYFKTGVGQYAEGDIFWGLTVPLVRKTARTYPDIDIQQLEQLLTHKVHEVRLCTLLIMVMKTKTTPEEIYNLYMAKTRFVNNWDLVDLSAPTIVRNFLINRDRSILYDLAQSKLLWDRRIAIISTYTFIKQGEHADTLQIATLLLRDTHDLIHKATGWMLREVGKRCSRDIVENFLELHAATMPRTALRYAIEHMDSNKKTYFMQKKKFKE